MSGYQSKEQYETFLNNIKALDPSSWPEECDVRYAENDVQELCSLFQLHNSKEIQRGTREYIDNVKTTGKCIFIKHILSNKNVFKN